MYTHLLLDQILAHPADDALRLVYADQLLTSGDERGEYITVELQLAAAKRGSSEHAKLARRRVELRAAHGARWWPELPEQRIGTRCGFAETIAVLPSELEVVPRLASREPIAALELLDYRRQTWPAHAPWPDRIRRLVVHGDPSPEQLTSLWKSPLCDAVEVFAAVQRGRPILPAGGVLPRCRELCFAGSSFSDSATTSPLQQLSGWDHTARLEVLDLSHCPGLAVIAIHTLVSVGLPALRVLRLSGNWISDDGAFLLAGYLRTFPALERIELLDARIGERGAAALRSAGVRAEIVLEAPTPPRIAIDAVGIELELVQVNESEWALTIDGRRRPVRLRTYNGRQAINTMSDVAAFGPLARALCTGSPRRLRGANIWVAVSRVEDALLQIAPDRSELQYETL